jgi:hypothetical protein
MEEYKTKGTHLLAAQQWVDQRLGAGTFAELFQLTPGRSLLPNVWYEVDPLVRALSTVAKRVDRPLEEIVMEIAARNARDDLRSVYRIFLRIAAPVRLMAWTPQLWSTYVRFGVARALHNEKGHYLGECSGVPTRLLDWVCGAWRGFVPTAIEVAGGKEARASIVGRWPQGGDLHRLQCEIHYG